MNWCRCHSKVLTFSLLIWNPLPSHDAIISLKLCRLNCLQCPLERAVQYFLYNPRIQYKFTIFGILLVNAIKFSKMSVKFWISRFVFTIQVFFDSCNGTVKLSVSPTLFAFVRQFRFLLSVFLQHALPFTVRCTLTSVKQFFIQTILNFSIWIFTLPSSVIQCWLC